jgi:myo-inositol 2-dehydrogenase/D-chiro-inositol 1-dehydrogenase
MDQAPGSVAEPTPVGQPRRLRVGVVGLAHYHVTGWVETVEGFVDQLEIVALYDPDPERARTLSPTHHDPSLRPGLGERYRDLPVERTLDDLVARHRLDLAVVTLPNADAPAAIEHLARAGIHLLIDKPAARSAPEARRAFAAVRDSGVRAVVGLTRRYSPSAKLARELVANGRLGKLVSAEAIFAASSVRVRDPQNPLFDPAISGGGILSWLGVHDVDTLLWLSGEPVVEVSAMAGSVGDPGLGVEDVISVALRFAGGAIGSVHLAYALPARGYRSRLALRGLDASLELGLDEELVMLTAGGADGGLREEHTAFTVPPDPGYGASGRAAVQDLLDAIKDGRETQANGEALVAALELIDAAYESARTGQRVRLA